MDPRALAHVLSPHQMMESDLGGVGGSTQTPGSERAAKPAQSQVIKRQGLKESHSLTTLCTYLGKWFCPGSDRNLSVRLKAV